MMGITANVFGAVRISPHTEEIAGRVMEMQARREGHAPKRFADHSPRNFAQKSSRIRREVLAVLGGRRLTVSELAAETGVPATTMRGRLVAMRDSGLVDCEVHPCSLSGRLAVWFVVGR